MTNANLFITATKARNNFFGLLEKIKKGPFPVNITVKGIPEVVMISKEEYDSWVATMETLSDPELMASIKQSKEDFKAGRYKTWEKVKKELGLDDYLVADKGKGKYVPSRTVKSSRKRAKKA